jgi:cytochrome P450
MAHPSDLADMDIPAHVDPARVVDFDLFGDPRFEANGPFEGLRQLRDEIGPGIFWSPRHGGYWFITDHEHLFEAARTPELFSNVDNIFPPPPPGEKPYLPPITLDGEAHAKYRLPLMRMFAPSRIHAMEGEIRLLTRELIEAVADRGHCDFMDDIAEQLPVVIFMRLMGYDMSRRREFRRWASSMSKGDVEERTLGFQNAVEMTRPLLDERRRNPGDDLLSVLLEERIDGEPINQRDLDGMCTLLLGAGLDTVVNAMGFGMQHVARHPELQDRLRAEPALIPDAVEELLRRYSVSSVARRVTHDADFHGAPLKAGEYVALPLPLGNLDPRVFPDPDRFDLERENKVHMTFNSGPHRCVGSHLARLELNLLYDEWLKRMPNVRPDPDKASGYRAGIVMALERLPLIWDPAADR